MRLRSLIQALDMGNCTYCTGVLANIQQGSIVAMLGPNGSGKSTLVKTMFGLTTIYDGSIKFEGKDITHAEPHQISRFDICYLPLVENLYLDLTVTENLLMGGYILSEIERETNLEEALDFLPYPRGHIESGRYRYQVLSQRLLKVIRENDLTAACTGKNVRQIKKRVQRESLESLIMLVF